MRATLPLLVRYNTQILRMPRIEKLRLNTRLSLLLFVIGAVSRYDLNLNVRIPLAEVLAFLSLPFLISFPSLRSNSTDIIRIGISLIIWCIGIGISDISNNIDLRLTIRGLAKPVWIGLWFIFWLSIFAKSHTSVFYYFLGAVLASIQNYVSPTSFIAEELAGSAYDVIAYGVGPIITSITIFLSLWVYKKENLKALGFFITNGVLLGYLGAPRQQVILSFINAGLLFYLFWYFRAKSGSMKFSIKHIFLIIFIFSILLFSLYEFYAIAAKNGWLGEYQLNKFHQQSQTIFGTSILGLISGSRISVLAAILAVIDNPLIGYGSWSGVLLSNYYIEAVYYLGSSPQLVEKAILSYNQHSAGHSILFQIWMENGILAAIGLLLLIYFVFRNAIVFFSKSNKLVPIHIFYLTILCSSILMSPFGVFHRFIFGFIIAYVVVERSNIRMN